MQLGVKFWQCSQEVSTQPCAGLSREGQALHVQAEERMQATFTVRSGRDRVKIAPAGAEPSEGLRACPEKDSPPLERALLRVTSPCQWGTSMPCTEFFLGSL